MGETTLGFLTAGVRIDVVVTDPDLRDAAAWTGSGMLAPVGTDSPPDVVLEPPPTAAVGEGGTGPATAALLGAVDRAARASTPCLMVHAAVVAGPAGAVVVPSASGGGKSTLAGAAMLRGLRLVSDEAACFAATGELLAHARPLGLDEQSRRLLGLHEEPGRGELAVAPGLLGRTWPPDRPTRCAAVVVPHRRPDGPAASRPGTPAEGLAAVLACCLNAPAADGDRGWSRTDAWAHLSGLLRSVRVHHLDWSDPHEGADRLAELVGAA